MSSHLSKGLLLVGDATSGICQGRAVYVIGPLQVALANHQKRRRANIVYAGRCSSLITSERLLDYMTSFQLEFTENIAGVLLALSKNMLGLIDNSLRT
jgi:hypothetical protein